MKKVTATQAYDFCVGYFTKYKNVRMSNNDYANLHKAWADFVTGVEADASAPAAKPTVKSVEPIKATDSGFEGFTFGEKSDKD